MRDQADPRGAYEADIAACDATLTGLRSASARLSTARVVTFLSGATALLMADVTEGRAVWVASALATLLAVVFVGEVAAHRRVRGRIRWQEVTRGLSAEGILRLDRRWTDLAAALPPEEAGHEDVPADHPYGRDLDIVGEASLTRLAGPVTSERGRARLRDWLLAPGPGPEVARRREAVRELAPKRELRHALAAHGRLHGASDPPGTDRFLEWAEGAPWLLAHPVLRASVVVLPLALTVLVVGDLVWGLSAWWLLPAVAQAELLRRHWRRLHADFILAEDGAALLAAYVPQLRMLEREDPVAPLLRELAGSLGTGGEAASVRLHDLARLLDTAQSRRNIFYVPLAAALLVDFHLAWVLDRWRGASGRAVREWLEALATWEALAALAAIAHDHPDWTYPTSADAPVIRAAALGHPLLVPDACVRNDVEVGPPSTFLLVTGSNMSGKSTLLRAIGANVVLATAGAPVCADALSVPTVRVRTSMRVDDSLSEGVSLFMAELLRIRDIVRDGDEPGRDRGPVLYLLDELLHGTNTAERRVAARAVIRHLLARDAIGAVSTHDLALAQGPDLDDAAVAVHFRESVVHENGHVRLTFDYRLRPGLATTRNALKLLDAVGLGGLVEGRDVQADEPER